MRIECLYERQIFQIRGFYDFIKVKCRKFCEDRALNLPFLCHNTYLTFDIDFDFQICLGVYGKKERNFCGYKCGD